MLANGAKLGYKVPGGSGATYTDLPGLKEVPDLGVEKERVENTELTAKNKQYEYGIGDLGELTYKFKYENKSETSPYRVMRKYADDNTLLDFEETMADGTKTHFSGQVSVKRRGGAVNAAVEFELKIAVSSDFATVDPS